jgi:hypothetical protein
MTLKEIRQLMNDDPVLIDVRGMMSRVVAKKNGIHYRSL